MLKTYVPGGPQARHDVPGGCHCGAAANHNWEGAFRRAQLCESLPACPAGEAIKGIPRDQVVIATKWGE